MMNRSIALNMMITEKNGFAVLLIIGIFTIISAFPGISLMSFLMIAACIPLWNLLAALFHKSIFGADGYTYMSFPISLRAMMIGKAVTANFWIMSAGMILIIGLIVNMKVSMADYTDMNAGTLYLVNIMESLEDYREASPPYDRGELASMAVKVVLLPFLLLGQSILFCAVFQAGAVLNHVLNPKRNRYGMTAAIIAAGTVFLIAFGKTADGISAAAAGSGYPTAGLLADMLLRAAAGVLLTAMSIRLISKKYELS